MLVVILSIIIASLYGLATWLRGRQFGTLAPTFSRYFWLTSFAAVILQGWLLHILIDLPWGQNLSPVNMLALIFWLMALLITLLSLRRPLTHLAMIIFPCAAVTTLLIPIFPSVDVVNTAANPKQLIHILLTLLTLSVLCIAGLQAIVLAVQEYKLRRKQSVAWILQLPPVETMENLLFSIILFGFILLSAVIITSGYFFFNNDLTPELIQKTIMVIIAWIIFAVLLLGRRVLGWRGRKAIYSTLTGVLLLIIIYFSSVL